MTVGELIERLQKQDKDRLVILSSDSEGNGKYKLSEICTGAYTEEDNLFGEPATGLEELTEELKALGYTEEDVVDGQPCVIFYP